MVTATSVKLSGIGACGLCTVTVAAVTRRSARQTAASRSASVSSRLTGSPADHRGQSLGQLAIVHGVGQLVGRGRRRQCPAPARHRPRSPGRRGVRSRTPRAGRGRSARPAGSGPVAALVRSPGRQQTRPRCSAASTFGRTCAPEPPRPRSTRRTWSARWSRPPGRRSVARCRRRRPAAGRGRTCARSRAAPAARARPAPRGAPATPSCARPAWRSPAPDPAPAGRGSTPAATASSTRASSSLRTSATTSS